MTEMTAAKCQVQRIHGHQSMPAHSAVSGEPLDLTRIEREFFSAMTTDALNMEWRHFDPPFPLAATDRAFINGWVAKQHGGMAREWRWTVLGLSVAAQYLLAR